MPREIPESIKIDVAAMKIGDAVKIKDIFEKYPNLAFDDDPESTLASVVPPRVEIKSEGEDAEAVAAEPEVIAREGAEKKEGSE